MAALPHFILPIALGFVTYVFFKLLWSRVLKEIKNRFGFSVAGISLTSVSGVSYAPSHQFAGFEQSLAESIRHARAKRGGKNNGHRRLQLVQLHVDLLWVEFHRPTKKRSSWISLRVTTPKVILCTTDQAVISGRSQPSRYARVQLLRQSLDKLGRMLRNSFIHIFSQIVDIRIDDLDVSIHRQDGEEMLRYHQDSLEFALDSDGWEEPADAVKPKVRPPNFSCILTISPFVVTGHSPSTEVPIQLLVADSTSTISFLAHISVLGRIERPHLEIRLNGICVSASDLGRIIDSIGRRLHDEVQNGEDLPESIPTSRHRHGLEKLDSDQLHMSGPVGRDEQEDMDVKVAILQLASLPWKLAAMVDIKPSVHVVCTRTSVTFNPSAADGLRDYQRENVFPSLLITASNISLSCNLQDESGHPRCIILKLAVSGIYVDLFHFKNMDHPTWHLLFIRALCLDLQFPLPDMKPRRIRENTEPPYWLDIGMKCFIDTPRIALSDELLCLFYWLSRERTHTPSKPPTTTIKKTSTAKIIRISIGLLRHFRPTADLEVSRPMLVTEITSYQTSITSNETAFVAIALNDIQMKIKVVAQPASMEEGHKGSETRGGQELPLVVETSFNIERLRIAVTRGSHDDINETPPELRDVLFAMRNIHLVIHLVPPGGNDQGIPRFHVNVNGKIGETTVDLSRLTCGGCIDYFTLMASLSSMIMTLPPMPKKRAGPTPNQPSNFEISIYSQIATAPIRCLVVGEDTKNALALRIENVLLQSSRNTGEGDKREKSRTARTTTTTTATRYSSRLEVNDIRLRSISDCELNEEGHSDTNALATGTREDVVLDVRRLELYVDAEPSEFPTGPNLKIDEVTIHFSMKTFYVGLMATLFCVKLAKLFSVEKAENHDVEAVPSRNKQRGMVTIDRVTLNIVLPEEVPVRLIFDPITITLTDDGATRVDLSKATLDVLLEHEQPKHGQILLVKDATFQIEKKPAINGGVRHTTVVNCEINFLNFTVPYGFKMSTIIENSINLQKGIKLLLIRHLGMRAKTHCSAHGRTHVVPEKIPVIMITVVRIVVKLMDDPFESALSRNYLLGSEEQEGRLARDKAFQKKAAALRAMDDGRYHYNPITGKTIEVENAWWMLQEFNSRAWLDRIRNSHAHPDAWFPPLMTAVFTDLSVRLSAPSLPASTVEESLHKMDPNTPARALYDDLIPRDVTINLGEMSLRIRDYPLPIVHIPKSATSSWKTEGLLIIAEQASGTESKRTVYIPLDPIAEEPLRIGRTVNPTKLYTSFNTTITTSSTIQLCWGAATEPGIADVMGVFDTFTKPNVDPSAPIGWWDKLRLILHGHNVINITGGGDIRCRILGSTSPYFDRRKHWGTEGVDICLEDGVCVDINGSEQAGEDITIECGELAFSLPTARHEIASSSGIDCGQADVIARMTGGARIALGFDFLPQQKLKGRKEALVRKVHTDLVLRAPEFCRSEHPYEIWDSFKGFRTQSIHVTLKIESPRPFYSGLAEPMNCLNLSVHTLERFFMVTQVYQSVLTSLPIRRGKIFQEGTGPAPSKQKLGRVISTLQLVTTMYPLLLGFVAEVEEGNGAIGLRCRAEKMGVDMTWIQHLIKQRRPKEELLTRKSTIKWNLSASEMGFTEIEVRVISLGQGMEGDAEKGTPDTSHDANDTREWLFTQDYRYCDSAENVKMIPFAWSPRIIYFRRSDQTTVAGHDNTRMRRDVYAAQMSLFRNRLREIESSIRHYLEVQKGLEYRMAVFFDDSLRQQSQIIVEKMAVLHEKKVVIERYIRTCQKKIDTGDGLDFSTLSRTDARLPPSALFKHHYIVHNVNFLWKKAVRNLIFNMLALQEKRLAVKYCLSSTATRIMSQLVSSVADRKRGAELVDHLSDPLLEIPKAPAPSRSKRSTMAVKNVNASMAQELLLKLLSELDTNFTVPNEAEVEDDESVSASPTRGSASAFTSQKAYIPSREPDSPDYVAENQTYESNYIVQLINPQVNLEAEPKNDPSHLETVVVAAESMQLRSVFVLDAQACSAQAPDEYSDRNEQIIKTRSILSIQNAQLFVVRKADLDEAPEFDLDNIIMQRHPATAKDPARPWPVWVPIECLIDHSSHSGYLQRVVERTSASFHRDVPNPLYLKTDRAINSPELTQTLHVNFPTFIISANAAQYMIIHDVIGNLLIYRDPVRGERTERLKKMMLVLEQMDDLHKVQETVINLQQKIRHADALLRWGVPTPDKQSPNESALAVRNLELQRHLVHHQDELIVIVNALKTLQILQQKRKSVAISWQTFVSVDKVVWCMLADDNSPMCQWTLDVAQFTWIQHEDQSSINTLHIDQVHVENQMTTPNAFKEVIAAYNPDKRDVDFTRHKMLRVYWREMAPVAGIKVVDHFEVNIFPLLIQVTYDMAKQIVYYLFPEKRARAEAKDNGALSNTEDRSSRKSFKVDPEQLTVRSIRSNASESSRHSSGAIEDIASITSSKHGSASENEASPTFERRRKFKTGAFSSYGHQRGGSNRSDSREDLALKVTQTEHKVNELKQMQARASENRSFIYIKMPGGQHCLSYRGSKEKNIEDLYMFAFRMPTLEFRNKTWTWLDFLDAVKREALRAVLANTGALVREKLFQKRKHNLPSESETLQVAPAHPPRPSMMKPSLFKGKKDRKQKQPDNEVLFDVESSGLLEDNLE
ncbi:uncharacterized protein SPPG_04022 [Spizellomyces punctatus DAOM BR117]|uniref:FMP27 GFWDK domain-containing protein n=1 Tax=Spizellomyces punctatus (strain DAOM BR117) TaxID=645134 RepID=A0A0L0HIG8_SPIPD|nr:uncharacterized protein SPPG_04022 [Spizellomyces punctatus DAOM BR117]KND00922.1 hypothetical protein SPPG_04022 [Spizellomyces punctatus DAOM BR117]|eukprot:XP_016608961.1 hypothetical protein SPPG_04022 [Spizellomyces punctatus DAOM BR117]